MRALILLALLAACETKSDKYCEKNPDDVANCGGSMPMPDAPVVGPACTGDGDCSGATPHCLDMMTCVGCRDTSDCGDQVCDPTSHACRACATNPECPSQLCLPGGTCAAASDIAYVGGSNSNNTACTQAAPCSTLRDAIALNPYPKYVRVLSDITETNTVQLDGAHALEVFGGGNKIQLGFGGVGLDVKDQVALTLHDVDLSHTNTSTSTNDDCIFIESAGVVLSVQGGRITGCAGDAINATDGKVAIDGTVFRDDQTGVEAFGGTDLAVHHALFRDIALTAIYGSSSKTIVVDTTIVTSCATALGADAAAIDVSGALGLTNSIVTQSGDVMNPVAGAIRLTNSTAFSKLDFVTIADNFSQGLSCTLATQTGLSNAIITGNNQSSVCKATYSLVSDGADGTKHTKTGDPKFLNTTDPTSAMFYRIGSTSDAIGIGMMDGVTVDIDGDARTSTPDVGADEYVP